MMVQARQIAATSYFRIIVFISLTNPTNLGGRIHALQYTIVNRETRAGLAVHRCPVFPSILLAFIRRLLAWSLTVFGTPVFVLLLREPLLGFDSLAGVLNAMDACALGA